MTSAPAQGMPAAEGVTESGLVGGIFSKAQHDGIHVKFSDVDWATIVRAGNVSQTEVKFSCASAGTAACCLTAFACGTSNNG